MHCGEFEARLQRKLDRRQRPELDSVLCAHAETCPECADVLEAQQLLLEGLTYCELPATRPHFAHNVVNAHLAQQAQRRTSRKRHSPASYWVWSSVLGVAAAILILAAVRLPGQPSATQVGENRHYTGSKLLMSLARPFRRSDRDRSAAKTPSTLQPDSESVNVTPKFPAQPASSSLDELLLDHHMVGRFRPLTASFQLAIQALRKWPLADDVYLPV